MLKEQPAVSSLQQEKDSASKKALACTAGALLGSALTVINPLFAVPSMGLCVVAYRYARRAQSLEAQMS